MIKFVILAVFPLSLFACADLAARSPNVVILFTDDQGTLDANCYGSSDLRTPNIDKLAATGVRFTQAYAHTVCCPARAALLTGRHPQRGGVHFWTQGDMHGPDGINMSLSEVTLAESLQDAGYRTGLFGKWHLGAHRDFGPKTQGFDEFFGIRDGFIDNYNHYFLHGDGYHDLYEGTDEVDADGEYFPEMMVQRSLTFIEQNRDRPFFLYVPFNIPHYPEQALQRFEQAHQHIEDPARRAYAAMIGTTDHYIGQIVNKLESTSVLENTIVIFMSDNGHSNETNYRIRSTKHASGYPTGHFYGASGAGNTGNWIGHKSNFFEGGVRVPAIIRYPAKLPSGQVCEQTITAMDWLPTVLELCTVQRDADATKLDGHSVLPLINQGDVKSKHATLHFAWGTSWAVRDDQWKLIGKHNKRSGKTQLSLHRLSDDEPEVKDYAKEQPDTVARLQKLHEQWLLDVTPIEG